MILQLMIMGHIIGDFYTQTDKMAEEMKDSIFMLIWHCTLYVFLLTICSVTILKKDEIFRFFLCMIVLGVLHGMIDQLKIWIESKMNIPPKRAIYIFVIDQLLHIGILLLALKQFNITGGSYLNLFNISYEVTTFHNSINMIIGILVCGRPTSIFVKLIFSTISIQGEGVSQVEKDNPQVGSYIGILERIIIFFLGMMGQYSAIGFVLTAKSVARYKQLEDRTFAEKYLVGTLLSALISIGCVGIYHYFKI